jgi:hypothetical protein
VSLTVAQLAAPLPTVLTPSAEEAAAATGFVRRRRRLTGATFTQALVFAGATGAVAWRLSQRCLGRGGRAQKRQGKPATSQRLLDPSRVSRN